VYNLKNFLIDLTASPLWRHKHVQVRINPNP